MTWFVTNIEFPIGENSVERVFDLHKYGCRGRRLAGRDDPERGVSAWHVWTHERWLLIHLLHDYCLGDDLASNLMIAQIKIVPDEPYADAPRMVVTIDQQGVPVTDDTVYLTPTTEPAVIDAPKEEAA